MFLSVVIPTRNRAHILRRALESLTKQTFHQENFEVIVIDNGSTDNTKDTVNYFQGKIINLVYIHDATPGLHIGRHRGLLAARTEILVYGDDDIEAIPTWLAAIYESFIDSDVVLVGGKCLPKFEVHPPVWVEKLWKQGDSKKILPTLSLIDYGDKKQDLSPFHVFGCNFSIRKNILLESGGFHPDGMPKELIKYRGDGETAVSSYIQNCKYKAVYHPEASVYHFVSKERLTLTYFENRNYNQGISDSFTAIKNGQVNSFFLKKVKLFIKKYLLFKKTGTEDAYIEGYYFHQKSAATDKGLRLWIKRNSYINDGQIPEET